MIKRLIAYGCSFTAGDELCDHELLSDADKIKKKYGMSKFKELTQKSRLPATLESIIDRQKEIAYPGVICRKLGISLDNRAVAGSSLEAILYKLITDIVSNSIEETDLILVGLTHVDRIMHVHGKEFYNVHFNHQSTWPKYIKYKQVLHHFSDETLFLNYYIILNSLIKICQDRFPDRFFIVKSCHWANIKIPENFEDELKKCIFYLYDTAHVQPQAILEKSLYEFIENYGQEVHSGGHPSRIVHERFAEYLYEEIILRMGIDKFK